MKRNLLVARLREDACLTFVCCVALLLSSCGQLPAQPLSTLASPPPDAVSEDSYARININMASIDDLEKLPGIGRVLAERIVAHREQYGPFRRPEHLLMVRGISDNKFRKFQSLISVD